ncbi:MAG: hypothetical protein IJY56_03925 [Clostridia bacterium]|nr:hypothetical protein [Clostridia bacterium]
MKPNLPLNKAELCIVSEKEKDIIKSLENLGIRCIAMKPTEGFSTSVGSHPDLFFLPVDDKIFLASNADSSVAYQLIDSGAELVCVGDITEGYPIETKLNIALVGNYAVCCRTNVPQTVIEYLISSGFTVIDQKQGYSRCSVCVVDSESIITSDKGIYNATKYKINTLLINPGGILLDGFDYGFIGGASVKLSEKVLGFFGRIEDHTDHEYIRDFCSSRGVEIFSLVDTPLRDIGGAVLLR